MEIRVLVADDEELARERIGALVAAEPGFRVVGECADGEAAVEAILRLGPDLVLLDVQMPGLDGLGVVREVGPARMPAVVFVTAYDQFALQAFDACAVDYVLKPIGPERFRTALGRARERVEARAPAAGALPPEFVRWLEEAQPGARYRERLTVRSGNRFRVVRVEEVRWMEAADNYVRLHAGKEQHLLRATMAEVEGMLDPRRFVRVHRSAIVNVDRVTTIEPWGQGEFLLVLDDATRITSSRGYRERIRTVFGC